MVINPDRVCITYPKLHHSQFPLYANHRIAHLESFFTSDEVAVKVNELREFFCNFAVQIDIVVGWLFTRHSHLELWLPGEVVVHGKRGGPIPFSPHDPHRAKRVKVFLDECTSDHQLSNELLRLCPQHTWEEASKKFFQSTIMEDCRRSRIRKVDGAVYDDVDEWELVLPRLSDEEAEVEIKEQAVLDKWKGWRDEALAGNPTFKKDKLKIAVWSEAEVCSCCGTKDGVY